MLVGRCHGGFHGAGAVALAEGNTADQGDDRLILSKTVRLTHHRIRRRQTCRHQIIQSVIQDQDCADILHHAAGLLHQRQAGALLQLACHDQQPWPGAGHLIQGLLLGGDHEGQRALLRAVLKNPCIISRWAEAKPLLGRISLLRIQLAAAG